MANLKSFKGLFSIWAIVFNPEYIPLAVSSDGSEEPPFDFGIQQMNLENMLMIYFQLFQN